MVTSRQQRPGPCTNHACSIRNWLKPFLPTASSCNFIHTLSAAKAVRSPRMSLGDWKSGNLRLQHHAAEQPGGQDCGTRALRKKLRRPVPLFLREAQASQRRAGPFLGPGYQLGPEQLLLRRTVRLVLEGRPFIVLPG